MLAADAAAFSFFGFLRRSLSLLYLTDSLSCLSDSHSSLHRGRVVQMDLHWKFMMPWNFLSQLRNHGFMYCAKSSSLYPKRAENGNLAWLSRRQSSYFFPLSRPTSKAAQQRFDRGLATKCIPLKCRVRRPPVQHFSPFSYDVQKCFGFLTPLRGLLSL